MRPSTDESRMSGSEAAEISGVTNEQMTVMMPTAKMMMNRMLYEESGSRCFFSSVTAMDIPFEASNAMGKV